MPRGGPSTSPFQTRISQDFFSSFQLSQQPLNIAQPSCAALAGALPALLPKGGHHQFPLLLLDAQDPLLDTPVHDQAPHGGGAGLAEAMHAIDGLVLDGGGPPRVREDDVRGRDEV